MVAPPFKGPIVSSPPPALSLYVYRATVVEVLDAVRFVANLDCGFHTWRCGQEFRLAGLIGGTNQAEAETKLRELIGEKSVIIQVVALGSSDPETTAVAKVWVVDASQKSVSVNGYMLENKLAQKEILA